MHKVLLMLLGGLLACQTPENPNEKEMKYNKLKDAASPYLQQHAQNPVAWYPWGEEALARALTEDKPILVSIGYSSCHWCHVMERESFENDSIAAIMNEHFINIKVDREERPDIDHIYMDAVQAMGINGGWPLNVFLTPEQKPFYGGTYFPPKNWATLLTNIAEAYVKQREEIDASANKLTDALGTSDLLKFKLKPTRGDYTMEQQDAMFATVLPNFDTLAGGFDRAPKFPMPSIWHWMLRYSTTAGNSEANKQVHKTLRSMAYGGIYDQIGGGFARYSTDKEWLAPHFEKMLYDNGQLLRLYAWAYKDSPEPLYQEVVYRTVTWLEREMRNEDGGFYAALDADSEGEEGRYYVWDLREFKETLGGDATVMAAYLDVSAEGNWEGNSILRRTQSDQHFLSTRNIPSFEDLKSNAYARLLARRNTRVRPGLDNKTLAGWNGMAITGLLEAYGAFKEPRFLELALDAATYITSSLMVENRLLRTPRSGTGEIAGYLEDYAFVIEAFIQLYQHTFDEQWLGDAELLTEYVMNNFLDTGEDMFFFTDANFHELVVRKKEIFDNVIPSSNSQMALNLLKLGKILDRTMYLELSTTMLSRMKPLLSEALKDLSNWGLLHLSQATPMAEVVIIGPEADEYREILQSRYLPNAILMGTTAASTLPLLQGKSTMNGRTTIYVCYNKTCKLPVTSIADALQQLQ